MSPSSSAAHSKALLKSNKVSVDFFFLGPRGDTPKMGVELGGFRRIGGGAGDMRSIGVG